MATSCPARRTTAYTIASVVAANTGTYTCQVSNFPWQRHQRGRHVERSIARPSVTVQPVSQTVAWVELHGECDRHRQRPRWLTSGTKTRGHSWRTNSNYTVTARRPTTPALFRLSWSTSSAWSQVPWPTSAFFTTPNDHDTAAGQTLLVTPNFTLTVAAHGHRAARLPSGGKNGEELAGATRTSYSVTGAKPTTPAPTPW